MFTETKKVLTHQAVMTMLAAAIARAEEIKQPQCIVIVDASGELLGEIRMSGAKFLSRKSARAKALTSASIGVVSDAIPEAVRPALGSATQGCVTGLSGGLPIWIEGELVGGIGAGSGTPEQDVLVGIAALDSIGAKTLPE